MTSRRVLEKFFICFSQASEQRPRDWHRSFADNRIDHVGVCARQALLGGMRTIFVFGFLLLPHFGYTAGNASETCVANGLAGIPAQGVLPAEMLKRDSAFRGSFGRLMKATTLPDWARTLGGVQGAVRWFSSESCGEIAVVKVCRPHWCNQEMLVLIYVASTNQIWGKAVIAREPRSAGKDVQLREVWLGKPRQELSGVLSKFATDSN